MDVYAKNYAEIIYHTKLRFLRLVWLTFLLCIIVAISKVITNKEKCMLSVKQEEVLHNILKISLEGFRILAQTNYVKAIISR